MQRAESESGIDYHVQEAAARVRSESWRCAMGWMCALVGLWMAAEYAVGLAAIASKSVSTGGDGSDMTVVQHVLRSVLVPLWMTSAHHGSLPVHLVRGSFADLRLFVMTAAAVAVSLDLDRASSLLIHAVLFSSLYVFFLRGTLVAPTVLLGWISKRAAFWTRSRGTEQLERVDGLSVRIVLLHAVRPALIDAARFWIFAMISLASIYVTASLGHAFQKSPVSLLLPLRGTSLPSVLRVLAFHTAKLAFVFEMARHMCGLAMRRRTRWLSVVGSRNKTAPGMTIGTILDVLALIQHRQSEAISRLGSSSFGGFAGKLQSWWWREPAQAGHQQSAPVEGFELIAGDLLMNDLAVSLSRSAELRGQVFADASGSLLRLLLEVGIEPMLRFVSILQSHPWLLSPAEQELCARVLEMSTSQFMFFGREARSFSLAPMAQAAPSPSLAFVEDSEVLVDSARVLALIAEACRTEDKFGMVVQRWLPVILSTVMTVHLMSAKLIVHGFSGHEAPNVGLSAFAHDGRLAHHLIVASTVDAISVSLLRIVLSFRAHFGKYLHNEHPFWPSQLNPVLENLLSVSSAV
ncbi:hypothetical protein FVE85_6798 [Porphyridium purpureum]|uniref:Uncharacterized protein n=1 Tax=Porphyridium purpureum TaxID=35688 RepID=A0A5J4Z8W3_PORPP|nr:hypothetical protein FVE85_6798 [Porphyridium purpureum]|eukprot:POR9474..scf295_1